MIIVVDSYGNVRKARTPKQNTKNEDMMSSLHQDGNFSNDSGQITTFWGDQLVGTGRYNLHRLFIQPPLKKKTTLWTNFKKSPTSIRIDPSFGVRDTIQGEIS